ncbi:S8 family serine peptidase [Actinoplanes sp. NPDC051346]|uniref:S8 family peptidase n=1 Tax=Actinoplanes sp. NPDC051346 TaxID=3155048 RepID=UPI003419BEA1
MKQHLIVKLRRSLAADLAIPEWVSFITDKSVVHQSLDGLVDTVLHQAGVQYWVTREFSPAGATWNAVERDHGLDRTYRVLLLDDAVVSRQLLEQVRQVPSVEDVRKLEVVEAPVPAPTLAHQTSLGDSRGESVGLGYAHATTRGRPDVTVAVLDTGVDLDHPELRGRITGRADFVDLQGMDTTAFVGDTMDFDEDPGDDIGHGTHVGGIVAGRGVRMDQGIAPECRIMAVRVLATMKDRNRLVGAGIVDNINPAIKWAVDQGADIINMSLGIKHTGGGLPHADVIRYALAKNVTVVAASGNDGSSARYYPGALPGVIAVGAADPSGKPARFSSFGAAITVMAPGVDILSSYARQGYAVASGTSQAAPFVAGCVALLLSYARDEGRVLTTSDVTGILRHTSDRMDARTRHRQAGYGLINMTDAMKLLAYTLHRSGRSSP